MDETPRITSKLSPANAVFDLEQEGLKALWRAELGHIRAGRLEQIHPTGPVVVAETPEGEIHVLEAETGRWVGVQKLRYGLSCPPVAADGGLYYVHKGGLFDWDLEAGEDTRVYEPPFAVSEAPVPTDGDLILAGAEGSLARWTPGTSKAMWRTTAWGTLNGRPVLSGDKMLVSAGEVASVAIEDGEKLWYWKPEEPGVVTTNAATDGSLVFVGDNRGHLYSVGVENGEQKGRKFLNAPLTGEIELLGDGMLVFLNTPEAVFLTVGAEPEVQWRVPGAQRLLASGGGVGYVLTEDGSVAAIALDRGEELWREPLPEGCVVAGNSEEPVFYVGNAQGTVVAFQQLD
ncbi:MAG: PQQ-binding-like beta-propeller repeat protein [Candidatus Brocadiia bacterium]